MRRWECSECGSWIDRPQPPARCRRCKSANAVFVAADDDHDIGEASGATSPGGVTRLLAGEVGPIFILGGDSWRT